MVFRLLLPTLFLLLVTGNKLCYAQIAMDSIKHLVRNNPSRAIVQIDEMLFDSPQDSLAPYLYKEKGYAFQNLKEYARANQYLFVANELFSARNKPKEVIYTEIQISSNYAFLSQSNNAIKYATKAVERAKNLGDSDILSSAYTSLSQVYYILGQYQTAEEYLLESERVLRESNKLEQLSATYNNLAIINRLQGRSEKALDYNKKSLQINKQISDKNSQAKSYNNIGLAYMDMKQYPEAEENFLRAIRLNDSIGVQNSNPHISLASLYRTMKEYNKERASLKKALIIEKNTLRPEAQKTLYQSLLKNAIVTQNNPEAFNYQLEIEQLNALINQKQRQEKLEFIEAQKSILENELKWQKELQRSKTYRWIIAGIFMIAAALGVILFQKRKQDRLKTQQIKSQLENKVLRSQMNPHFIFNTLTIIQNSLLNNNSLLAASSISRFAKLIRQIFDITQKDFISLRLDLDVLQNYIETQLMRFENGFDYSFHVDTDDDPEDLYIPPMLMQPFVENAIEHGIKNMDKRGTIDVMIKQKEKNTLAIKIRDNGKGFAPKKDGKLHATDIVKTRLKLNKQKDYQSFYIKTAENNSGTEVGFNLTTKLV